MQSYAECPQVLRDFLSYHESIKGQSRRTVEEYHLDLRMFFRFLTLMRRELPYNTPLDSIDIKWIDAAVLNTVTSSEIFDFLSYLANDRQNREGPNDAGIAAASRARKLSAIKALYKYLTVSTKQISNNPVKDIEFPKIRRSLPKYLTLEESTALLKAVDGPNKNRDFAILMLFLNCGIRRSELVGLNLTDVYEDRIRVVGKGNKERMLPVPAKLASALRKRTGVWLFPGDVQGHCGVDYVAKRIKTVTGYPSHSLRRRFATCVYYRNGCNIVLVSRMLGHANIATTMRYIGLVQDEMRNAVESTTRTDMRLTMPMNQVVGTAGSVATYSLSTARIG